MAALLAVGLASGTSGVACGGKATGVGTSDVPRAAAPIWTFDSLDARPVSAAAFRGRVTVVAFITTWDLASQAQVDFLAAMAKRDGAKVNYAAVALQRYADRELVEVYQAKLGLPFPVAIAGGADDPSVKPFAPIEAVPTIVVFDTEGRVVFRKTGLAKSDELRAAMRGL